MGKLYLQGIVVPGTLEPETSPREASMTARHCSGCRGYTHGWDAICPGVDTEARAGVMAEPDFVPPLPFASRLKVLLGLPVLLGVSAGPLGERFEHVPEGDPEATSQWWAGPEGWKDVG